MIESKTNQKLKKVRKLISSAKERKESGLFVVEGSRLFSETPQELIREIYISEEFCSKEADVCKKIMDQAEHSSGAAGRSIALEVVRADIFKSLSDTVSPQGILAVVKQPVWPDRTASVKQEGSFLPGRKIFLLDGLRDPGNLGTIIRTSEAAGVQALYMSPDCVDLYNPKVIRSTMGCIFRVPVYTGKLMPVIDSLRKTGRKVYATDLEGAVSYKEADLSDAAIVIGNEAEGVSRQVLEAADARIKIPMMGQVESLNAAVSAAILMYA